MKKLLLLFVTIISMSSFAQNADQIYNNYVNALGGKAKLTNVKSIQMKIVMSMPAQGMEIPMETYQDVNGIMYSKMSMMDQELVAIAFDGKKGYKMNQQMGYEDIKSEDVPKYIEKAKDIFGSVLRYKERGDQLTYIGKEKMNDIDYDALKLSLKEAVEGGVTEMKILFNPKTHLIDHIIIEANGMTIDSKIASYVEVEGVKFVEKLEVSTGGQIAQTMTISDIKINVPAPQASVFVKPKE